MNLTPIPEAPLAGRHCEGMVMVKRMIDFAEVATG